MSNSDKVSKKTGKIHTCSKAEPNHQSTKSSKSTDQDDQSVTPRALAAGKPDFDIKDRMVTPERKASGPTKKRRRSVPSTTTNVTPEAKIKPDSKKDDL